MASRKALRSQGSRTTLNDTSGAIGFATEIASDAVSAQELPPKMAKWSRNQVPQKNAHLEELFRLRKELDQARGEIKGAEELRDMMAQDLFEAKEAAEEKAKELRTAHATLARYEDELKTLREKVRSLSNQDQGKKRKGVRGKISTVMQKDRSEDVEVPRIDGSKALREAKEEGMADWEKACLQSVGKFAALQEQVSEVKISLAAEKARKKAAPQHNEKEVKGLHEQITRLKIDLDEKDARLKAKTTRASARLGVLLAQVTDLNKLLSEQEAQLVEQNQRCDFFKGISERLTKQVKEAVAARREWEQSEDVMAKQLASLKLENKALEQTMRMKGMPGSFYIS